MFDSSEMVSKAYNYAVYLLSLNDLSVHVMHQKLTNKGYDSQVVETVISRLLESSYLDDIRYAKSYMMGVSDKYGPIRIHTFLRKKGVSKENIEKAAGDLEVDGEAPDIMKTCIAVAKKRLELLMVKNSYESVGKLGYNDKMRLKQKLFNHLSQRGYPYNVVKEAIEKVIVYF